MRFFQNSRKIRTQASIVFLFSIQTLTAIQKITSKLQKLKLSHKGKYIKRNFGIGMEPSSARFVLH